jgi:stearoyl-CoA desaturase (delta-9 desaturase)
MFLCRRLLKVCRCPSCLPPVPLFLPGRPAVCCRGWQVLAFTLLVTHITIAAVTIFLHRAQAHRALELHALPSHFFRFWLWLTTGMVTKEWVAIHRKHHAKCETDDDPHSPVARHPHRAAAWQRALPRRGQGAGDAGQVRPQHPDDWLERHSTAVSPGRAWR